MTPVRSLGFFKHTETEIFGAKVPKAL